MTVRTLFGSWGAALRAAGYPPNRERWTPERIAAALREFAREEGRAPIASDLRHDCGLPARPTIARYFGSLAAAREAAGLEAGRRR
jgi:hypothetical protein